MISSGSRKKDTPSLDYPLLWSQLTSFQFKNSSVDKSSMFNSPIHRVLYCFISWNFYAQVGSDATVSKSDLFILSYLIDWILFNVGMVLYTHLMQVSLDEKKKRLKILYSGMTMAFAQRMINFSISQTRLQTILGDMFLTLKMLQKIDICKWQKDGNFIFAPSCIDLTAFTLE